MNELHADVGPGATLPPTSLDLALALAATGLPVFPCTARKTPAISKAAGGHGFQDASTDPDRVRELWAAAGTGAQLVGVPTGPASRFDVLDIDPRHGGDAWEAENSDRLSETRMHSTPSGGRHWLFVHVDGVRNGASKIAPGVDVRGQGGYVCFPPSPGYAVIHETDIAPWPDWLLPLVIKAAEPAPRPDPASYATPATVTDNRLRGFIDREVRRVRDAPVGGRHDARLAAARSIGGVAAEAGLSDTEAEEMLIAARPPEVEEEKERKTIRDGLAYGRAEPIDLNKLPDSAQWRSGHRQRGNGAGNGAAAPEPDAREESIPEPGETTEAESAPEVEPERTREPYGPPTLADYIADLATLDEIAFGQIAPAEAAKLGITPTALGKARSAAKAAAAKAARDTARAAKAKADADAKAAKAEAKARDAEAKADERVRRAAAARKRLDAQKTLPPLTDDDEDPLHEWTPPHPDALPEIIVAGGERPAIADAALAHMKAAGVPFYQRGKELVRVCLIKLKLSNGEMVRVPAISAVTKPMLLRALGLSATWHTYTKEFDLVRVDPPGDLADHILGMIGEWPFPPLRGVIATQTMRHDGTLLTKPGYDRDTGLVLFNPPTLPAMPEHPTKQDALDALAYLNNDLLTGFDFADDDNVSRAGAISMLMTPVLRGMMPAAPIHFITKPDAGSGGSYLQDLMSAIALGERCPTISLTLHNDEENEKRLSSAAHSGQPVIAIDNFTGTLMGNFFCQLIERPMPQIRILGKTEMVTIPNNHCVVANGINIAIGTDAVRRGVRIELDPDTENPSERSFTRDPVAEVLANRGPAVAAVLTIPRAYRLAGMPGRLKPRPSFEVWSDNVRSALVWLGWPDCDESLKTARAADPHTSKLFAVMSAWATNLPGGTGYRTGELVRLASEWVPGGGNERARADLWDALFAIAGTTTGQLDPVKLGTWLRDHQNRISAGHKLINDTSDKSRPKWKLEPR